MGVLNEKRCKEKYAKTLHYVRKIMKNDQNSFTTLCNEGVQILNRKVSEFYNSGQKKCPKFKSLDILWEIPGS